MKNCLPSGGIDVTAAVIFILLLGGSFLWKKWRGKKPSSIALIGLAAILGAVLYGLG